MRLAGFPGITYSEDDGKGIRIFYRIRGKLHNKTFHNWTDAMKFVREIYPTLAIIRVRGSEVDAPENSLMLEAERYPDRLARTRRQSDSKHGVNTVGAIKRIIRISGFALPSDVTTKRLDQILAQRIEHKAGLHSDLRVFLTFLKRLAEDGAKIDPSVLRYKFVRLESQRLHHPWTPEENAQWWNYLSAGMEQLASTNPSWSWRDRIRQRCLTCEFAERMFLIPLYMVQSRYMIRPSESRRLQVDSWDSRRRAIIVTGKTAKYAAKLSLLDRETAWLAEVCAQNRPGEAPLFLSPRGLQWQPMGHAAVWRRHLDRAGLANKKPYDVKYTTATFMFDHAEEFNDTPEIDRISRVRAITGHTPESKSTELYIKSLWGSPLHLQVREFYDRHRMFPFRVEEFPSTAQSSHRQNEEEGGLSAMAVNA